MSVVDLAGAGMQYNDPVPQEVAEALGAKLMAAAADVARHEAAFLDLVGEFDAIGGAGWWTGIQSTAHWLAWACSIAPGTAREHVRVARALRRMPLVRQAFGTGDLTYSKVRELTRVAGELNQDHLAETAHQDSTPQEIHPKQDGSEPDAAEADMPGLKEAKLVEFAQACTASQLARTVRGRRAARGASRARRAKQKVSWIIQEDGTIHLSAILPAGEGAAVITAIQAATDANTDAESRPGEEQPDDADEQGDWEQKRDRTRVEALAEICNHYLASLPDDRSGEDRRMVVIEVSATALAGAEEAERRSRGNVSDAQVPDASPGPAAAEPLPNLKCRIRGGPSIEATDAQTALCDSVLLGIITDPTGVPLAVGREQRLVTKHQRRALMTRDGCCQYPGCHRARHLQAHHRLSWASGGATDLENLILLCKHHHTTVHEGQIGIKRCSQPGCHIPWGFSRPDGSSIAPTVVGLDAPSPWRPGRSEEFRRHNDQLVADWEAEQAELDGRAERLRHAYDHIDHTSHPDARQVFPVGGGEGFRLVNCVDALFHFTEPLPTAA